MYLAVDEGRPYNGIDTYEAAVGKKILIQTSIGVNIREAHYAHGTADFIAKLQISLKEANETGYWLELLFKANYIDMIAGYDENTKSATVTVKEEGAYTLIFAKYGDGNRLDKGDVVEFNFKKGENTVPQEIIDFTLGTGDKIMLWHDMTTLVHLCEAYIVK